MDLKITPSGQTIVKPTALGPGANTDTKLLIYGLFQKGRVLAQDGLVMTAYRRALEAFAYSSNEAFCLFQPNHPLPTHSIPLLVQVVMNPRGLP